MTGCARLENLILEYVGSIKPNGINKNSIRIMETLKSILTDLDNKKITKHQAYSLILGLFDVGSQRELLNAFAEWLKNEDDHNLINKYTVDAYLESI